jgi:hypothetical protein
MKGNTTTPNLAILIKPLDFSFNNETSSTNLLQNPTELTTDEIHQRASHEFGNLLEGLISAKINVTVLSEKKSEILKPDAVFSNNWIVYMPDGRNFTMPMLAKNRRAEIDTSLILGYAYHHLEQYDKIALEGTGSMVMDHINKKIYAGLSSRTNDFLLREFAIPLNYKIISFNTEDVYGYEIYHTNVLMSIGEKYAIICDEVITENKEKVIKSLENDGKEIIYITEKQMQEFCGNIFEMRNNEDDLITIMSTRAYAGFNQEQIKSISKYSSIVTINVDTIENIGGGGVRCMITGSFL